MSLIRRLVGVVVLVTVVMSCVTDNYVERQEDQTQVDERNVLMKWHRSCFRDQLS